MERLTGAFDSFRVEEAYNWHDDLMEITRAIVRQTDEARLANIAEHFKVDLSEIREWLEEKNRKKFGGKNAASLCETCKRMTCAAQGDRHEMPIACANYIPSTKGDMIRSMTDEELAQWICCHITECSRCEGRRYAGQECGFRNGRSTGMLRWLKSPAEEDK